MKLKNLFRKKIEPNYFLYTSTYSKDFRDLGLYYSEEYRKSAHATINKLYNSYKLNNNKTYLEAEFDNFTVHCFLLKDKRKDVVGRVIYSFFGVIVDKKDSSFDIEELKSKVAETKLGLTKNVFDFAKTFPIIWRNDLNEVCFHEV